MKEDIKISKQLSYLLRHNPKDLNMDKDGYVQVSTLLNKIGITKNQLDIIVENNDKKRFAYSPDESKIRASQGHTIKVDVGLDLKRPKSFLYHGTTTDNLRSIMETGLSKMKRNHVHLTDDYDTAVAVGKRYSKDKNPMILEIDAQKMIDDGYDIYISENNVWLIENVPPEYIKVL